MKNKSNPKVYPKWDMSAISTRAEAIESDYIRKFHNWANTNEGKSLTVAVVDSGVDKNHPVFKNVEVEQFDLTNSDSNNMDDLGHGTAVAGVVAQLSPSVGKILSVKVFGDEGRTSLQKLLEAYELLIELADKEKIDLANFSLGASQKVNDLDARHNQLASKVRTITASGNSGGDSGSPATADKAFSIGALTRSGEITDFSSYEEEYDIPDLCALGKNIKLARAKGTSMGQVLDENYVKASGTSFAAPITTAAIANYLVLSKEEWDRDDFHLTADSVTESIRDGNGSLNLENAIAVAKEDEKKEDNSTTEESIKTEMSVNKYGDNKNLIWLRHDFLEAGTYSVTLKGNKISVNT
jgi:subtilisin family serine protease